MALTPNNEPADDETQLATRVTHSTNEDVLDQTVSLPEKESGEYASGSGAVSASLRRLDTLRSGDFIGGSDGKRFQVVERLGAGTMGVVHMAHDSALDRTVALKMTDFGIKPPVALLGTLRTRDAISISFDVLLDRSVVVALSQP